MNNTDTTAIKDGIYPMINKALSSSTGVSKYKKCVQRYIDYRPQLFSNIPNDRLVYGEKDSQDFYMSLGLNEKEILNELSKTFYWNMNFSPISAKDPLTIASLSVVRYFVINKDQKNAELSAIYFAFTGKNYPSAHYNSFRFLADDSDAIMNYVVNTQLNQRFDLKREGSIFGAIRSICITWLNTYPDKFKSFSDDDVAYLIKQLISRIKSFMKNIATLYYESYANKDYFNYESDNMSDDNFRIVETDIMRIEKWTEVTMTYISNHSIDYAICTSCADSNVKKDEIKAIMEAILNNQKNLVIMRELISLLLSDYMANGADKVKDIRGLGFISHSIKAKPNAKDKNLMRIKEIITTWLEDNSIKYRRRKNRPETRNSYYKSILNYVVLIINKANK